MVHTAYHLDGVLRLDSDQAVPVVRRRAVTGLFTAELSAARLLVAIVGACRTDAASEIKMSSTQCYGFGIDGGRQREQGEQPHDGLREGLCESPYHDLREPRGTLRHPGALSMKTGACMLST